MLSDIEDNYSGGSILNICESKVGSVDENLYCGETHCRQKIRPHGIACGAEFVSAQEKASRQTSQVELGCTMSIQTLHRSRIPPKLCDFARGDPER